MTNFVIGVLVGAVVGALAMGCMKSAAEEDKRNGWK